MENIKYQVIYKIHNQLYYQIRERTWSAVREKVGIQAMPLIWEQVTAPIHEQIEELNNGKHQKE